MSRHIPICLIAALWIGALQPAFGSDDDLKALITELAQQVKHLNNRVADLEQQLTRERISRTEQTPPSGAGTAAGTASTIAATQSISAANNSGAPKTAEKPPVATAVTAGDFSGSFKIPGTESSLGIGGFIKLDAMYNSVSGGRDDLGDQALGPSSIPVGQGRLGENSQLAFHAKESRLWFKTHTPGKAWGDFSTYLEFDFYGSPSTVSYTPRLRHAYGTLGHLTAGQTWTTFANINAVPELLELNGPIGKASVRQPLIRWSQPLSSLGLPLELQTALEAPKATFSDSTSARSYPDDDRYPDMVVKLGYDPSWGSLSVAGIARQLRVSSNSRHNERNAWTGGVSLAGKIRAYELDNIRFMLNYGNGIGRYASLGSFDDAIVMNNQANPNRLAPISLFSGYLSYQHWWNSSLRSTVAYGFAAADNPVAVATLNRQTQSLHFNLLWSPLLQTTFGVEYIYAQREREDHASGSMHRVQLSTRFNF